MSDAKQKMYPRFRLMARIEHLILLLSFTVLSITGLPQMFAAAGFSQDVIQLMGGITQVRIFHRYAAFLLILGTVYHLFTAGYRWYVKGERMRILPEVKDVRDVGHTLSYNFGLVKDPPKMAKFNFGEKVEYWAVVWGTAVMVLTGFMLWNPIAVTAVLPGEVIPAAKTAHGAEALLAVLSIVVWHFYNVLIKHRNWSMFTGNLPHNQMEEEHALELERLEAGGDPFPGLDFPAPERRKRIYFGVSAVAGVLIVALLVWLFTFEETAITTLPAVTREIFVPLTTPTPAVP
jgi:formate dehydrogenase gamma subunit